MSCTEKTYMGKLAVIEWQAGCGNEFPSTNGWSVLGAVTTKDFSVTQETEDITTDSTIGDTREVMPTFKTISMSADGQLRAAGVDASAHTSLSLHALNEKAVGWFRISYPDITVVAFMVIASYDRSAETTAVPTWSISLENAGSPFGITALKTPPTGTTFPTSITPATTPVTLLSGAQGKFDAPTIAPSGANLDVVWESDNELVISVQKDGTYRALQPGVTKAFVMSPWKTGTFGSVDVTVQAYPQSVTITGPTTMSSGTVTLTAAVLPSGTPQTVTWTSSAVGVATVSAAGVVTKVAAGTVVISAASTVDGTVLGTHTITVS